MKISLTIIIALTVFYSCNQSNNNFNYEWKYQYTAIDKDLKPYYKESVFFRNDSSVSFSEIKSKEITFPLVKSDSTLIVKYLYTISNLDNSMKRDTTIIDTVYYDFKYVLNYPVLVLISVNGTNFMVLACTDKNATIVETNNFLKSVDFKIRGFDIGDSINQDLLTEIEDCDSYDCQGMLKAKLKQNKNINMQIIGKKYIYKIEEFGIDQDAVKNILNVVNDKLKVNPDTFSIKVLYRNGYRWDTNEIDIELEKANLTQYYLDKANENKNSDEFMKNIYLTLAEKNIGHNNDYTLEYNHKIKQAILKYKYPLKTVSKIIE